MAIMSSLSGITSTEQIVTDGLIVNLDAGNPSSYSGSGTTWTDISGTGNAGTLTNGPTYSTANRGTIVFDGTNDYVLLPINLINWVSNPFSISIWFKTSTSGIILGQQNTNTPAVATGFVPAIYVDSSGNLKTSCFWGGATTNISTSPTAVWNGAWNNVVVTVSGTNHLSYLNGSLYSTISKTQTSYAPTYYYYIGVGTTATWPAIGNTWFNGSISNFNVYNKQLTAGEVSQNFNALRSRYGI
jgi:hypothetical protein